MDVARGSFEAGGTLIEEAVDVDVSELSALEAGLVVLWVITGQGGIMVTAGPPNFGVF